ncbi:hypothetical protein, partial [Vibrio cidicii]|uniref:hypothetical protein n=1 Tax=Vibrio cidicii TaxID=1763883 RepID=UPI003704D267
ISRLFSVARISLVEQLHKRLHALHTFYSMLSSLRMGRVGISMTELNPIEQVWRLAQTALSFQSEFYLL